MTCPHCGEEVENVRDIFTGAMFPINLEPARVRGFTLQAPDAGERARRAVLVDVEVFEPHLASCKGEILPKGGKG